MSRQDWLSVAVALLAGIGVVGAAAYTAAATAWRERAARRAERDARALAELVEAALALRDALRYAPASSRATRRALEQGGALFRYRRMAVRSIRVRDLAGSWEQAAHSATSRENAAEAEVWDELLGTVGQTLRDLA